MAKQNGTDKEQPALLKSGFARQTRKYIQLMDELRACGTSLDIDVPTIAILGNQSSGKSSVIEAISGIALPRASGTCTRCPTEVRLIRKDCAWRCKISLRFEKDAHGVAKEKVEERPFGEEIFDASLVTERLRRAQHAILLASDNFAHVLEAKLEELPKPNASFSENTVCITIYGPECVDLSFIDLSGIIVYAGDGEDESDITVVERMARNAVSRENCIILLTITCTDDIQNQSGATLAREVDPQGNRTIGVLTKPDLIPEDDHPAWLDILSGKAHPLRLGYYGVKNPGTKELQGGVSNAEARKREAVFFAQEPWSTLPVKGRLGTAGLANKLSSLLEQTIAAKLPELTALIHAKLMETNRRLDRLPNPIREAEAPFHLVKLCQNLGNEVMDLTGEEPKRPQFNQQLRDDAFSPFAYQVLQSPPLFFVDTSKPQAIKDGSLYAVHLRRGYEKVVHMDDQRAEEYFGERQRVLYSIEQIRAAKLGSTGFELPGNLPYHVKTKVIKEALEHWPHLAQQCFAITKKSLDATVRELLDKYFAPHVEGGLQAKAHQIATELQAECEAEFQLHLKQLLRPELSFVYTNSSKEFTEAKDRLLSQLLSMRPGHVSFDKMAQNRKDVLKEASQVLGRLNEFDQVNAQSLIKALPADEFEQELLICAEVLAYFRIAAKRVIDNVPMAIIVHYVQSVGSKLQDTLLKRLEVYGENAVARCAALLAEDPDIIEKRAELQAQKQRLTESLAAVRNFGMA